MRGLYLLFAFCCVSKLCVLADESEKANNVAPYFGLGNFPDAITKEEYEELLSNGVDKDYLDILGTIKTKINDLLVEIGKRYGPFSVWLSEKLDNFREVSKPHVENMKIIAVVFIKEMTKVAVEEVIKEGHRYFKDRQSEIGVQLWTIVDLIYQSKIKHKLNGQADLDKVLGKYKDMLGKLNLDKLAAFEAQKDQSSTEKSLKPFLNLEYFPDTVNKKEYYSLIASGVDRYYLDILGLIETKLADLLMEIGTRYGPTFHSWLSEKLRNLRELSKPHVENMKIIAVVFIKEMTKAAVEDVIRQGHKFFKENQSEIGAQLWSIIDLIYQTKVRNKLNGQAQLDEVLGKYKDMIANLDLGQLASYQVKMLK